MRPDICRVSRYSVAVCEWVDAKIDQTDDEEPGGQRSAKVSHSGQNRGKERHKSGILDATELWHQCRRSHS